MLQTSSASAIVLKQFNHKHFKLEAKKLTYAYFKGEILMRISKFLCNRAIISRLSGFSNQLVLNFYPYWFAGHKIVAKPAPRYAAKR